MRAGFYLGKVEEQNLTGIACSQPNLKFVPERYPISGPDLFAIHGKLPGDDLDPRMTARSEMVLRRTSRRESCRVEVDVLMNRHRAIATIGRSHEP